MYVELRDSFSFLWTLDKIDESDIKEKANNMLHEYPLDLDSSFPEEPSYFKVFYKKTKRFMKKNGRIESKVNVSEKE